MSYSIETNHPIPDDRKQPAARDPENEEIYAALRQLRDSERGTSFFMPVFNRGLSRKASTYARRMGFGVRTRHRDGGLRVWKISN